MTVDEDREKLKRLIGHWVEHNRSHEASYSGWAEKAREMGDEPSAEFIDEAVKLMKDADALLL
ncbi:MAG: hypothetical protein KAS77_08680, partial [Thermoplasmata archaeon]|nr:hypothetical protein [Thermoplasmata archaeon]